MKVNKNLLGIFFALYCIVCVLYFDNVAYASTTSDGLVYEIEDGNAVITGYKETAANVVIPEKIGNYTVTKIGYSAFEKCEVLKTITFPDTINEIDSFAFLECINLTKVDIPKGMTEVGNYAFYGCTSLTEVNIPAGVTSINDNFVWFCEKLASINVASDNQYYTSKNGVLFNKEMTTLHIYPQGKKGAYTIPSGVEIIDYSAFWNCTGLTSINIPSSVTVIYNNAFSECTGLTVVDIPNGVLEVGVAFSGCTNLQTVNIPASVNSIFEGAFENCYSLTTINVSSSNTCFISHEGALLTKDKERFITCPGGQSGEYTIPSSVTMICSSAFTGCKKITAINIPDSVTFINYDAFSGCEKLTKINLPDGITEIGTDLFRGCTSLNNITIPDSVESIEGEAFKDCTNLTTIFIPENVESIGLDAFIGCTSLEAIEVDANNAKYSSHDGIIYDKDNKEIFLAPEGAKGTCEIMSGTKRVDFAAFVACPKLSTINIPASVEYIEYGIDKWCPSITTINVDEENTVLSSIDGIVFNKEKDTLVLCPEGRSGDYVIPEGVTQIGDWSFSGCENITSVIVSEGAEYIGNNAFYYCSELISVDIPSTVHTISINAFDLCENMVEINVSNENQSFSSYEGVLFDKSRKELWICPTGKSGVYTIPDGVTSIYMWAFDDCLKLEKVIITKSVTEVGSYAFCYCENIIVEISPYVNNMGDSVFSSKATIICYKDSYADLYAEFYKLKCKYYFDGCTISIPKEEYEYTGNSIKPPVRVTQNGYYNMLTKNKDYKVEYKNNIKSGTATIIVTGMGDFVGEQKLCFKIKQFDISNLSASISQPSFGYTGDYIKPVVTVKGKVNGKAVTLTNWKDYKVTYKNFKNPGTASITVTGRGNYFGELYLTFTIRPIDISKFSATIKQSSFAYTGNYIKPVVTVKGTVNGKTVILANWKDYKITYKNFKNPGQATMTITGRNGYAGTKTITFYIRPSQVKNVKYVGKSTSYVNFKWDKCVGVTGYEVYRSTSKTGTYTKVGTVSATSFKNTGLKKGTTYYYKVRAYKTVGSTKLYGAYSSVYTLATSK